MTLFMKFACFYTALIYDIEYDAKDFPIDINGIKIEYEIKELITKWDFIFYLPSSSLL